MLGNDVVDLGDPESHAEAHHPRFDRRVFDEHERALIAVNPHPERRRWTLWAAKESAFKAARKADRSTCFEPRCFGVRDVRNGRFVVTAGPLRFRVDVRADAGHVHAVARHAGDPCDDVCAAVATLPAIATDASLAVRTLAVMTIARRLGLAPDDVTIVRDGRIPFLCVGGRRTVADLSLSHHGRFVAFACTIPGRIP